MRIRRRRGWELPEREATPESVYLGRRELLRGLGAAIAASTLGTVACERRAVSARAPTRLLTAGFRRNPRFGLDRPLTAERVAGSYNNYYEFGTDKERVAERAERFKLRPWTVEVAGLVHRPRRWDLDALAKLVPLEERLYRHRCVEAWAMAVPWIGLPLGELLRRSQPLSSARFVRFVSFLRPEEAVGQREQRWYPWPYFEGLSLAEATCELTLLATGIYGHDLPAQHGAPLRLVVPWKYGFKSIKGIVRIELVAERPPTFWNQLEPKEYDFQANVNPAQPHPRWSQASERMLGTDERRPTLLYNGYAQAVASLYR